MDIQEYASLDGDDLKARLRSLSRSELDDQLQQFGGQYAVLCQRLEALYSPGREAEFWAIRPGGLNEIDKAIERAEPANTKEITLLKAFRELNRVVLPFMDVYEEQFLADVKHLSKDELQALSVSVSEQIASAEKMQLHDSQDLRHAQNASGTLRLATLMKEAVVRELKERFNE